MVSWVVMTVDPKKLMNEWAKKNTATPMEPKTTAIHPAFNRGRLFACSSSLVRNFQPCRLVAWQNCWKQPEDVDIVGTSPLSLPPISHIDSNVSSDSLMMGQCGIKSLKSKLCLLKGRKLGIENTWLLLNFRIFRVAHLAVQYARKIDKDARMPIHKGLSIVSSTLPLCKS